MYNMNFFSKNSRKKKFDIIKKFFTRTNEIQNFKKTLQYFSEPVLLTDLSGNILYNNQYTNELFGYTTLINSNIDILLPDSIKHKHSMYIKHLPKNNINSSMTKRNIKGNQQLLVLLVRVVLLVRLDLVF